MYVHSVILDGEEDFRVLANALRRMIQELENKHMLTIKVKDATIERNPHGDGMWNYTLKVNENVTR
jgi:hypothetical protein